MCVCVCVCARARARARRRRPPPPPPPPPPAAAAAAAAAARAPAWSGTNFGDGWAYFESVHGSAPDIAGKGIANPTATILSAALMLEHMGMSAESQRLEAAVGRIYRDGKVLTPDQGGTARTRRSRRRSSLRTHDPFHR